MYGIMEEKYIVSNFISHLSRALVSSLPTSPIPDVKSCIRSDPCTTPQGLRLSVRTTQKLYLLGPETQYFLKHQCLFLKERNGSIHGKGIYGFPPMKWFSLNTLVFWSYRDSCYYVKGAESMRMPLKDHPSHLGFLSTVTLLNVISPLSLLAFFMGPSISFPGYLYYMAHSSWHILFLLSDRLKGVKSLWLLFLILPGQLVHR